MGLNEKNNRPLDVQNVIYFCDGIAYDGRLEVA
jgi:hypothetical protein